MTAAAITCITSNAAIIATGAPGSVNGVANDNTSTTAATTRKVRIGRLVNRPITANTNAPNNAGTKETETTAPSVTGPCPGTTTSGGIAPNAEVSKYTTAFTTAATAPASGPAHNNRP